MASETKEEARLTRYLLGEMPERERERIEEAYFADDAAFEQMLLAEEELIDAYARGELSAAERERFEQLFLTSPRWCERVQVSRALISAVLDARPAEIVSETTHPSRPSFFANLRARRPALRFALAAVALAFTVGLPWFLIERAKMNAERAALDERAQELERRVAAEQTQSKELPAQPEGVRAQPTLEDRPQEDNPVRQDQPSPDKGGGQTPRPSVLSFVLTPGLVRGGGARALPVPGDVSSIVLRLNIEASTYVSYSAVIETAGGRQVWRVDSLKPPRSAAAGGTVVLPALPASDLPPGDYVLLLRGKRPDGGFEGVADYSFKVVRK